jgi:hypothetical protein
VRVRSLVWEPSCQYLRRVTSASSEPFDAPMTNRNSREVDPPPTPPGKCAPARVGGITTRFPRKPKPLQATAAFTTPLRWRRGLPLNGD